MDAVLQPQLPREVSKEWGAPTSVGHGGSRGIYLQLGLVVGGQVPARRPGMGLRGDHTKARQKYPVLGQGPRPVTPKQRSDVSPGEGLLALLEG